MTFGKLINTMDILVLELPQFQGLQHSRYACHIILGVVQHTVACMCLLWYFQSLSKCPTWFSLYCHMIQLWIPSDLVKARYTVTVHVCQVVLEPARCQELWHSNYVLFHKLGFMAYNVRQCQCAHNMYCLCSSRAFSVHEVWQQLFLVKWFGRHN